MAKRKPPKNTPASEATAKPDVQSGAPTGVDAASVEGAAADQPTVAAQTAPTPAAPVVKPAKPKVPDRLLTVVGPRQGRRRIGRAFGPDPVEIPLADLSEAEKQALIDDPRLTLTIDGVALKA